MNGKYAININHLNLCNYSPNPLRNPDLDLYCYLFKIHLVLMETNSNEIKPIKEKILTFCAL